MSTQRLVVPSHRPLAWPTLLFVILMGSSVALLLLSMLLARSSPEPIIHPLTWLRSLDVNAANDILSNAAEVVAAVLAVVVTVVAIVVELAANRYSHQITRLFLREPVNLWVMALLVLTAIQCLWTVTVMDTGNPMAVVPHAGFALTLGLVTLSLLLLVPYIYFVFWFLSPISVIQRICRDAYSEIVKTRGNIRRSQQQVLEAIDELQDVARSAIQRGDRGIAMAAVAALANLLFDYVRVRERLPQRWFDFTESVSTDPDFIALAPESLEEVRRHGLWLERKIMRRFVALLEQSAGAARDVAHLIGIKTQTIATDLGSSHPHMLELAMRGFNSYLRVTIGVGDARTAYYLMNLYRTVASHLLHNGRHQKALEIAGYLAHYGQVAFKRGLPFLLETAAHDLVNLVEAAVRLESPAVDRLLELLLELDQEIREEGQEENLLGVRRAQMQLATLFLMLDQRERAQRIVLDLRQERLERLERLRKGLLTEEHEQFWEFVDRGVNFSYLSPERRAYLARLFDQLTRSEQPA
jgi:hypothetical protein